MYLHILIFKNFFEYEIFFNSILKVTTLVVLWVFIVAI